MTDSEAGVTATSAEIPANPKIPCHDCGTEERFITMKRDPDWLMEYVDPPRWVAYCPDCRGDRGE